MNGSWDAYLASPADFSGADDIVGSITSPCLENEPTLNPEELTLPAVSSRGGKSDPRKRRKSSLTDIITKLAKERAWNRGNRTHKQSTHYVTLLGLQL